MNALSSVLISQGGGPVAATAAALSVHKCSLNSPINVAHPIPPLFSNRRPKFLSQNNPSLSPHPSSIQRRFIKRLNANAGDSGGGSGAAPPGATKPNPATPLDSGEPISLVGQESVPLEGVIQFEKNDSSSPLNKWGWLALLAGGDVTALLLFSAIGRFSHGFSVFDAETLRTADPFIAGWFLSAYFLGGYGEDGRGMNGLSNAVIGAAKSWVLGIPLGLIIRAATVGHTPPPNFILVTMGSTAVLLIGWRALLFSIFRSNKSEKNDLYKRGSPFELFELLTSLVRRW